MQKGISTLVGIIIIVAVAVLAFGGVFAWQYFIKSQTPAQDSNTETAGWKTYTNNESGFEIKYPNDQDRLDAYTHEGVDCSTPFYEFVKNGGVIDAPDLPYTKTTLKSLSKIITEDNLIGYKTTWTYSNSTGSKMFDLTIANFRNEKTCLVAEIFLSNSEFSSEYNHESTRNDEILSTFKFIE